MTEKVKNYFSRSPQFYIFNVSGLCDICSIKKEQIIARNLEQAIQQTAVLMCDMLCEPCKCLDFLNITIERQIF